jgi:hypothetical protein
LLLSNGYRYLGTIIASWAGKSKRGTGTEGTNKRICE